MIRVGHGIFRKEIDITEKSRISDTAIRANKIIGWLVWFYRNHYSRCLFRGEQLSPRRAPRFRDRDELNAAKKSLRQIAGKVGWRERRGSTVRLACRHFSVDDSSLTCL